MTYCDECKQTQSPENPEVGVYNLRTKRYYPPLCQGCSHEHEKASSIEDRVSNLEAISAMPGQLPRRYEAGLEQLQGQVNYLQNALNAALDRGKKRAAQVAQQKESAKPRYRGLSA